MSQFARERPGGRFKPLAKLEAIAEARRLYLKTGNIEQVSAMLGINPITVTRWLRDLIDKHKNQSSDLRSLSLDLCSKNVPISEIAQRLNQSRRTISRWTQSLRPKATSNRQEARRLYQIHQSTIKVGQILNIGQQTIHSWVKDLIPRESTQQIQKLKRQARRLYTKWKSLRKVGKHLQKEPKTIKRWVQDLMPESPDWKLLRQEVRDLYQKSGDMAKIHETLGVSYGRIREWTQDLRSKLPLTRNQYSKKKVLARKRYQELGGVRGAARKIAKELGVDPANVYKWIHDLMKPKYTPEQLAKLKQQVETLYPKMKSIRKVATQLGIDPNMVRKWKPAI